MTNYAKVLIRCSATKRFLFQLRDNKPHIANPGMWSLIGGSDDEISQPPEMIARIEALEETGLRLDNLRVIGNCNTIVRFAEGHPSFVCSQAVFLSIVQTERLPPGKKEGTLVWMTLDEFLNLSGVVEGFIPFLRDFRTEIDYA